MVLFRHHSIRRDLVVIMMTISLFSTLITGLSISYLHYLDIKERLIHDLEMATHNVSTQNRELIGLAHITNVQRKIFANLTLFESTPSVRLSCLYDKNYKLIAFYDAADHALNDQAAASIIRDDALMNTADDLLRQYQQECPNLTSEPSPLREYADYLAISAPILKEADDTSSPIGWLYAEADIDRSDDQLITEMTTTAAVCAFALLISYLLAIRLQRSISRPIQSLSEAARNVTVYKDYSVRVDKKSKEYSIEINDLIDHFNSMLKEIGDRDGKLMRKNVELERAKEMAESANMSKSQFLANISHELRTPLNAIIGFSSIIINQLFGPIGNDKYIDYGKDIHESGVHLLDIINDILDLSKAEAGKLGLRLETFDVKEALQKCMHIVTERAEEGNVTLNMDMPPEMPQMVADRVRFIQIILNILSNAIKFTEAGGRVDLTAECENAGNEVHYFTFVIKDNGIGMRKADIDMAFETFGQVDSGLDRRFEGTGLGLPLTKKLVELHNGSIRIDSQLHQGTTVSIRFISDKALL